MVISIIWNKPDSSLFAFYQLLANLSLVFFIKWLLHLSEKLMSYLKFDSTYISVKDVYWLKRSFYFSICFTKSIFTMSNKIRSFILGGDYMISVCQNELLMGPGETDFTLRLHGESNFILARWDSFPPGVCVDWFIFFSTFFKHVLNCCFILLRQAEVITWEYFILTKQDPERGISSCRDETSHVTARFNLWRVHNSAGTEFHPG